MNVKLLRRVAKHILAEPKRLDMGVFIDRGDPSEKSMPKCGTVGCIAGWTCLLSHGMEFDDGAYGEAQRLLGITTTQADHLFMSHLDLHTSKTAARKIVKHIEDFIKTGE